MTPRAITGLGVVSTIGVGKAPFYASLAAPRILADEPAQPPETFDAGKHVGARVVEARGFDAAKYLGDKGLRTLDRLTKLMVVAARLALHDGGLKRDNAWIQGAAERVGICMSNAYGSLEAITELDRVATLEDARYINPAKFPNTVANSSAGYVSIWEDLRALNVAISDGNCGALDAIACAEMFLDSGRADALLVGGAEAMSEALYLAFHRLGALDERTRLGEGAVLFLVEPPDLARARGATVIAEVTGYGTSFVAPANEALIYASREAMERAIRAALEDAGLAPGDVSVVASGVSGLRAFDDAELAAIRGVLGAYVPVAAPKALVGETLGAGGAMAMAAGAAWLARAAHPFPIVSGHETTSDAVDTVLVTLMGFYGNASAVVMRRPRAV